MLTFSLDIVGLFVNKSIENKTTGVQMTEQFSMII